MLRILLKLRDTEYDLTAYSFCCWEAPSCYRSWLSKEIRNVPDATKKRTAAVDDVYEKHWCSHRPYWRTCRYRVLVEAGCLWNNVNVTAAGPQVKLVSRSSSMATSRSTVQTVNTYNCNNCNQQRATS